ncbi:ABC transporter permease [Klebsiella pneumoniae]|uniref:ABC transporter permease n=1 Tax=Klebsiella pneumoniae TaxID=573 RepID=A0A377V5W2_KLEPN|nr:ABC transporter permease [Klebsiella pneumoniae]
MGNALLPALNIAGLLLGELIAGALITETVFGRSGLGQLTQQAVNNQDIAVLQAVVMISALGFVLINLLVDLVMPRLGPPTPFTDRRCEMSLVDYTIAVRRRPEWRRVRLPAWPVAGVGGDDRRPVNGHLPHSGLPPLTRWRGSPALSAWRRRRTTGWGTTSWGATCGRGWFTARCIPCRRR